MVRVLTSILCFVVANFFFSYLLDFIQYTSNEDQTRRTDDKSRLLLFFLSFVDGNVNMFFHTDCSSCQMENSTGSNLARIQNRGMMSYETWRNEFYPIDAISCPKEEALDHSIQKWKGLRKENLERHGVYRVGKNVYESEGIVQLRISNVSCALCVNHQGCDGCPLFNHLNRACDNSGPYDIGFVIDNDIEPMIVALEACVKT